MAKFLTKGITLIELVLYMGIFFVLVMGVLQTSMYMQEILQYNSTEYSIRQDIYRQLELVQNHLYGASSVEVGTSSLRMYYIDGYVSQELIDQHIHMIYVHKDKPTKDMLLYPFTKFTKFSFKKEPYDDTLLTKSVIHVDVERLDNRKYLHQLTEYILKGVVDF